MNLNDGEGKPELTVQTIMDGWLAILLFFFLTELQSYQDDGKKIMQGCEKWNPVYIWKDFHL